MPRASFIFQVVSRFLAYYMGAPSDQFLRKEYGGPLRSVSSLLWRPPYIIFLHTIWDPLRSVSLHAILRPPAHFLRLLYGSPLDQFILIQYRGPFQISFFIYYLGSPSDQFLCIL